MEKLTFEKTDGRGKSPIQIAEGCLYDYKLNLFRLVAQRTERIDRLERQIAGLEVKTAPLTQKKWRYRLVASAIDYLCLRGE